MEAQQLPRVERGVAASIYTAGTGFVARHGHVRLSVAGAAVALSFHARADARQRGASQAAAPARRRFVLPAHAREETQSCPLHTLICCG